MGADGLAALGVLGDPTRRAIFERLARHPGSVGEVAAELPVSRPAVSQHLRVLKDAGLVVDHAVGTRRIYQLDPTGVAALRGYLDQIWTDALAAFAAAVRADAGTRSGPHVPESGQEHPSINADESINTDE